VTLGAGIIRREWFGVVEAAPEGLRWARFWDLATSTRETADYTASIRAVFSDTTGLLYLADGLRGRWEWPDARRVILQTLALEPSVEVGVEQVAFQQAAVQDLLRAPETHGRAVRGVPVDRDKLTRAQPWIARAEAGKVALVRGAWVADFLAECEAFPQGHDDQVDATSGAVALLTRAAAIVPKVAPAGERRPSVWSGAGGGGLGRGWNLR
jgi:predicted phage terminase large subunit-like protein